MFPADRITSAMAVNSDCDMWVVARKPVLIEESKQGRQDEEESSER